MSERPEQVWVMLPIDGPSSGWLEATTSRAQAATFDGPGECKTTAHCYVPAEDADVAYRVGVRDGRREGRREADDAMIPVTIADHRGPQRVLRALFTADQRVADAMRGATLGPHGEHDERQLIADDAASAWRQAAMTVDDTDLIDEDPLPPMAAALGLRGDLCAMPIFTDYGMYLQTHTMRARDAWAHYHGWPELARGGK